MVNFTLSNYPLILSVKYDIFWNQKFLNSFSIKSGGEFSKIFRGVEPNISDRSF